MSCCAPGVESAVDLSVRPESDDETLLAASRDLGGGVRQLELALPDVHCAACIKTIEDALSAEPMVEAARVNFSSKRVRISYRPERGRPSRLTQKIREAGYRNFLLDPESDASGDATLSGLVRALAVAGFAAGNIMLFSVSIWSGADAVTRDLFHWISALIALPAVAYAGQPFFKSAFRALQHGALNMDVPISLAVILATAVSLFETINQGQHAYFDASVSLLFFLLIGRTLDHLMRERARSAVRNLAGLAPKRATRIHDDASREQIKLAEIEPGMLIAVAPGDRVAVDGEVAEGQSDVDLSLVNGESVPERVMRGSELLAGTLNISGPLVVRATRPAANSFLARMIELMEAAEGSRAGYKRIADRAAAIYAPVVHVLGLATFLFWGIWGGDWHAAMLYAIAVLIITCPCALALAVPIVHVVAAGRLFENGVMMRDGAALERLAEVCGVVFDKTGTLTLGRPQFEGQVSGDPEMLTIAARLAAVSQHPFSRALSSVAGDAHPPLTAHETPGQGVEAEIEGTVWRWGRAAFCNADRSAPDTGDSVVWLSRDREPVASFAFSDAVRPEAVGVLARLRQAGLKLSLFSGDRGPVVRQVAALLQIDDARAEMTPEDKVAALNALSAEGGKVLMVGDGLNDAPALRAAHTSMAPSSASDIGRNAADFIFTNDNLAAVPFTLSIARRAAAMVRENFGLAIAYNIVAVPLAVTGHVTPLVAAIAMSSSSILVTLNALRLRWGSATPVPTEAPTAVVSRLAAAE